MRNSLCLQLGGWHDSVQHNGQITENYTLQVFTHRNSNTSNSLNVKSNVNDSCHNGLNRLSAECVVRESCYYHIWLELTNSMRLEFFAVTWGTINRRCHVAIEWCRGLGELVFFVAVLHKGLAVVRLGQLSSTDNLRARQTDEWSRDFTIFGYWTYLDSQTLNVTVRIGPSTREVRVKPLNIHHHWGLQHVAALTVVQELGCCYPTLFTIDLRVLYHMWVLCCDMCTSVCVLTIATHWNPQLHASIGS